MAGTREGGKKAAQANIARHGVDFYKNLGAKGGSTKTDKPKGFAADRDRASWAGKKGGTKSRRGKAVI